MTLFFLRSELIIAALNALIWWLTGSKGWGLVSFALCSLGFVGAYILNAAGSSMREQEECQDAHSL